MIADMSSVWNKFWKAMTVSPKRRRTKRQSESSSNSSGSDSSDTDSDNARSITIGGRRLRRTAARTAQQANRSQ